MFNWNVNENQHRVIPVYNFKSYHCKTVGIQQISAFFSLKSNKNWSLWTSTMVKLLRMSFSETYRVGNRNFYVFARTLRLYHSFQVNFLYNRYKWRNDYQDNDYKAALLMRHLPDLNPGAQTWDTDILTTESQFLFSITFQNQNLSMGTQHERETWNVRFPRLSHFRYT